MKNEKLCMLAVICTLAISPLNAQTIIPLTWEKISQFTENNGILSCSREKAFLHSRPFPVNPNKSYTLIATMRSQSVKHEPSLVYLSFAGVDDKNQNISTWKVRPVPQTLTYLTEAAKKGDRTIQVKNARNFIVDQSNFLVYDAREDESDIPTSKRMSSQIIEKVRKDKCWCVTLQAPLLRDFQAGTVIRQHLDGGYYLYPIGPKSIGEDWETYSVTVKGVLRKPGWNCNKWPKGTVMGRVVILPNWQFKKLETQFRDIRLIEY